MSWTVPSTRVSKANAAEVLGAAEASGQSEENVVAARDEQVAAARAAAVALIESGALGDDDREFSVSLSGHANPDHAPAEGWANDYVGITISQAAPAS